MTTKDFPYKHLDSAEALAAIQTLSGPIPPEYLSRRDARGGTALDYVKHTIVTRLLQQAFGPYWSKSVSDAQFYRGQRVNKKTGEVTEFTTASALVTLTLYIGQSDGSLFPVSTTAVGVFDNTFGLPEAAAIAAAASRGLCRAVAERLGFGWELYLKDDDIRLTAGSAWSALKAYAEEYGIPEAALAEAVKTKGFTRDDLVPKFGEMGEFVEQYAKEHGEKGMPVEVTEKPAALPAPAAQAPAPVPAPLTDWAKTVEEQPDPVVEAAQELGAVVVKETPAPQAAPAQAQVKVNWVQFYKRVADELGISKGSEAASVLSEIYGKADRKFFSADEMFQALQDWLATKDNDGRDAVRAKYRAMH